MIDSKAIDQALAAIAPAWPLDSLVASSPYWGLREQSFSQAADTLRLVADSPLHLPRAPSSSRHSQA
ncbi:putative inorganic carbon transporter subunit DabA, partial [Chromobacterium piscinae]|uniref:putative inorganic carbon transporter subunit DabA n=1 Tax=Chromobacterium piscinae TaxID=686831 RepID=UPI0032617515